MSTQVTVLEEISLVTPLGVRFWDVSMGAPAGGGLSVVAYRDVWPDVTWTSIEGPGGVYSFRALPGLHDALDGAGDDAYWSSHPPAVPYVLAVTDPHDRYLPFQLTVDLPCRGLCGLFSSPPITNLTPDHTWIPIFSTPSRPISGPAGAIRAQLQNDQTGQPAAWAMMTAQSSGGPIAMGIADGRGVISLAFSYPEPRNFAFSSPLGSSVKLTDQSWPLTVSVFYRARPITTALPFLDDLLQQPLAFAWSDTAHTSPAGTFQLLFGNDLVLRSRNSANGSLLPVLLVTPAGSPL